MIHAKPHLKEGNIEERGKGIDELETEQLDSYILSYSVCVRGFSQSVMNSASRLYTNFNKLIATSVMRE